MMKKLLFVMMCSLLAIGFAGCSDEEDDFSGANSIVGTWELKAVKEECIPKYPERTLEIPAGNRYIFMFDINGKVKMFFNTKYPYPVFPREDGEYDYSYDKKEQLIHLGSETLKCIVSDGEMRMECSRFGADDSLTYYVFLFTKQ
jgi:hypothetical protein